MFFNEGYTYNIQILQGLESVAIILINCFNTVASIYLPWFFSTLIPILFIILLRHFSVSICTRLGLVPYGHTLRAWWRRGGDTLVCEPPPRAYVRLLWRHTFNLSSMATRPSRITGPKTPNSQRTLHFGLQPVAYKHRPYPTSTDKH